MIMLSEDQCVSIAKVLEEGLYSSAYMDDGDERVADHLASIDNGVLTIEDVRQWAKDVREAVMFCKTHLPQNWKGVNEDFLVEEVEEQWAERQAK